ncbi:MAG: PSD1 and planctomycete cytochrome C domain-containing protein [Fimbriimonadaceae bacterium]
MLGLILPRIAFAASLLPIGAFWLMPRNQSIPTFKTDVLPILNAHCSPCHTGERTAGALSLNDFEAMMKGGSSGPVVTPKNAETSLLLSRILGKGGLPRMPMGFKPLDDHDVKVIRDWINSGALDQGGSKLHWAYSPLKKPKLPVGTDQNPIDAFIRERLRRERLQPSPPADRVTLIRRLSLDLIGLPPTPTEVDDFLNDKSPQAYERVVDRLLASAHYGERMALPWLDAARYADSNGFQQDGDTYQYVWRDWVVRSLNANMPFDQFTIEQLAGDLLPSPTVDQMVATAFNRNHMLNGEGGAIPEEQRTVNLFDRVDTTSATWLGITVGCARCHDHKYDPITQRDYYSMMAYFNNVPESGVPSGSGQYRIAEPTVLAGDSEQMAELSKAEAESAQANRAEEAFIKSAKFSEQYARWITERKADLKAAEAAKVTFSNWFDLGKFSSSSFDQAFSEQFGPEKSPKISGDKIATLQDGTVNQLEGEQTAFYFGRVIKSDLPAKFLLSIGSDDGVVVWLNHKVIISKKVARGAAADQELLKVELHPGENQLLIKIINGGGIGGIYFKAHPGGVKEDVAAMIRQIDPKLKEVFAAEMDVPEKKRANAARTKLAQLKAMLPRVMVMSDAQPRQTHIFSRGNYEEPLELVNPAPPVFLGGKAANRLELAKWIVSPVNPLTARVQVNRAWQLFFGRGLVRSEENFGVKGEPPTHPELLDWLAADFRDHGWNVKRLHKQIVMSATYRQSSKVSPEALKRDPANIFLARSPRFRLPSMLLRDVALKASGLLNAKIGGRPVYPYQPTGIWDGLAITLERDFTYPQSAGADNHRRSLYTFWRRTVAPGNMFDSSSRQVCTVKPSLTSTPLHALTMMNDTTWVEAGRALAERTMTEKTPESRLTLAFRLVCARRPNKAELNVLLKSLSAASRSFKSDPAAANSYLSVGESKSNVINKVELAAYAAVCLAIFNLDEAITRE